jgi:hypothetical protein
VGSCSTDADCLLPTATVALCCDQANNEWAFETCSFSDLVLEEFTAPPVPVVSPLGAGLLAGLLGLGIGFRRRRGAARANPIGRRPARNGIVH